ncbi:UVI-1 protein [Mycena venus]|uniref:UVI-1 protein n=1 Tax=Mycena venus TaxID=2733690 RepID=A0A8H7CCS6_9AGAR|nr:UVI-1 protein [Mycena venus]
MKLHLAVQVAISSTIIFPQVALGALTPDGVVDNIRVVGKASADINTALGLLTPSIDLVAKAPTIAQTVVTGFTTIVKLLTADVTVMQGTPPFDDVDAGPIVDVLTNFVRIHQALLSTVIGKHSIFAQFGLAAPIAAILRSLESIIDTFAFALIAMIPTKTASVEAGKNALDTSVKNTIELYTQLCLPSPLYPLIPPVCITL